MNTVISRCVFGIRQNPSRNSNGARGSCRGTLQVERLESRQLLCEPCANAQITEVESGDPDNRVPMAMPVYLHAVVTVDGIPSEECKLNAEYRWRYHMTAFGGPQGPLSPWSEWVVGAYWWSAAFVGPNDAEVEARWLLDDGSYRTVSASGSVELMPPVQDVFLGFEPAAVPVPTTATIDAVFEGGYTTTDEYVTAGTRVYERFCNAQLWNPDSQMLKSVLLDGKQCLENTSTNWWTNSWRDTKGADSEPNVPDGYVYYRIKQTNFVLATAADGVTYQFPMTTRTFDRIKTPNNTWIVVLGPDNYDWP